jgi:hypothetical protein
MERRLVSSVSSTIGSEGRGGRHYNWNRLGSGTQCGTGAEAVGGMTVQCDRMTKGVGGTFSDVANTRSGGCALTPPTSFLRARFAYGCGRSSIGGSTSWGSSLLSTPLSYRRCSYVTALVRIGDMPSSAEIAPCMRICRSRDVMGCRDLLSYAVACQVGDAGSEDSSSGEEDISLICCAWANVRRVDGVGGNRLRAHVMERGRGRRQEARWARYDESKDGIKQPAYKLEVGVDEADTKRVSRVTFCSRRLGPERRTR